MKNLNRALLFIRGIFSAIGDHARKDWPAAIAVTALVTIIHIYFGWFDAIDRFAYVVLGHRSSLISKKASDIVLVVIDEKTQVEEYLNRSPLDRCELNKHLSLIYSAQPLLVVVDFDLSPALWIRQAVSAESDEQRRCEEKLYNLIESNGNTTVLMLPFRPSPELEDVALTQLLELVRELWKQRLEDAHVHFGDGTLPVDHGVVFETSDSPESLSRVALCRTVEIAKEKGFSGLINRNIMAFCKPPTERPSRPISLDFRQTIKKIYLSEPFGVSTKNMENNVVFFGANYGQDEKFLTLQNDMYGVDLHALGYVSGINGQGINMLTAHMDHGVKFAMDLLVAFIFGTLISYFWRQFFKKQSSDSYSTQKTASMQIVYLSIFFLALLYAVLVASQLLLSSGIWLSPVPIALGMMIESFSVGSLTEALELLHKSPAMLSIPGTLVSKIQISGQTTENLKSTFKTLMPRVHLKPHSASHTTSPKSFFWSDWRDPFKNSEPWTGAFILLGRLVWSAILGWAVCLMFFQEH